MKPIIVAFALGMGLILNAQAQAQAQSYPNRTIKLISPLATGGTGDAIARLFATEMSKVLGQSVVVEARPGAGGSLGFGLVANSAPDGYTIVLSTPSLVTAPIFRKNSVAYLGQLAPIALLAKTSSVLVVNPNLPVSNLQELMAYAKSNPGKLNYGSGGVGTATHLNMALLLGIAGVSMVHVPYVGSTPMRTALIGGQIHAAIDGLMPALPHLKSGKLRALAIADTKRSSIAPEIATTSELGLKGSGSDIWYGLLAPAETSPAILATLYGAVVKAAQSPELRATMLAQGAEVLAADPDEFRRILEIEKTKWTEAYKWIGKLD